MKVSLIIMALATVYTASAQGDNQKDLVDILNVALHDKKIPTELINTTNPKSAPWTNAPFIVVKSDSSKKLERFKSPPDSTHVWILDYEDIFMLEVSYGLIPLNITRKTDRLTLEFKTVKYPAKDDTKQICHSGRLTADRKGDTWIIINSKIKETKCQTDMYGHKK